MPGIIDKTVVCVRNCGCSDVWGLRTPNPSTNFAYGNIYHWPAFVALALLARFLGNNLDLKNLSNLQHKE